MVLGVEVGEDNVPFIEVGEKKLRLDLEELQGIQKERARDELRETPENVEAAFVRIRELIQNEPGLHLPVNDEAFLLKFLRPFKFYPESAFKVLKRFYKFKSKYPKYGMNLTPHSVRHVFDSEVFVFLPGRTPSGSRVLVINIGTKWIPKCVSVQDMFRAIMVAIEIAMLEPQTQLSGVHVIINSEGLSLKHIYQFSPSLAKLIVDWVQECAPIRLKGIHVVNQAVIFNMIFTIFKPFLGEKLKKRIFFHSKKSILDQIPADCLPMSLNEEGVLVEYPGKLLSEMLYFYENTFELFNSYRYATEGDKECKDRI